jgi:hypothetical protein
MKPRRAGQAGPVRRSASVARAISLAFADLIAHHGTDGSAAEHADRTAQQDCTTDRAYAGAGSGILLPRIHAAATTQAEQYCHGKRTHCNALYRFHRISFWSIISFNRTSTLPTRAGVGYFSHVQLPLGELLLDFIFGDAISFLDPAGKSTAPAGGHIHVIIGEPAPLQFGFALELFPVAFDTIPVHCCVLEVA